MNEYIAKAAVLIEALPYIQQFRDAIVVVKFGGSAMEDLDCVESTIRDIVFMELVGMKPVIVHGGGKKISEKLASKGINTHFVNGLRFTCENTITVVDDVLHDDVNPKLVDSIIKFGGRARSLSGKEVIKSQKMLTTNMQTNQLEDIGFVGKVIDVSIDKILDIVNNDVVPVITPMGKGAEGEFYNINSDVAACGIAEKLKARKLVFLSDVPGILKNPEDESSLISTIRVDEVDDLIEQATISKGMIPKIQSAIKALMAGTNKVHLIDGRLQHSLLLEIFTDQGVGTQIIKS